MRGEVYRLPARGKGYGQRGPRFAVVLQPDWLTLSTWVVAFTSTSARDTSFRPSVEINQQCTLVMWDQIATVDVNGLTEPAGILTLEGCSVSTTHSPWCSICSAPDDSHAVIPQGLPIVGCLVTTA